jgi:polysaccharide pyruvyl transferase CsaB
MIITVMFILHGYLNHGNYGDELLAEIVERRLKKHYPETPFVKLSSKNSFAEHFKLLNSGEYLICLGGLFQDKTSLLTPLYYFLTTFLAHLKGMKILYLAQGIGPLEHPLAQWLCKKAFKLADFVSVRDKSSAEFLKEAGIRHFYGADLAWTLYSNRNLVQTPEDYEISPEIKTKIDYYLGGIESPVPILCLKKEKAEYSDEYIERFLTRVIEETLPDPNSPIIILEMQDSDALLHRKALELIRKYRMANNVVNELKDVYLKASEFSPNELLYCLNKYGSSITAMRLHALILGHIAGLKCIAIAVEPKINDFVQQIDIYNLETLKDRAEKHYDKVLFLSFT